MYLSSVFSILFFIYQRFDFKDIDDDGNDICSKHNENLESLKKVPL